jgi:hypothetical protein
MRCLAVLLVLLGTRPAAAEVKRYALLVGANQGRPHEVSLRFAESDVDAVAETLRRVGGYPSERIVRLLAPTAERVRGALLDLNLAIQEQVRAGHEAVLFVYYSGHADGQFLHLGGTDLSLSDDLGKLVRLSPAKLKILLVDACRAGSLTRVKGGRQVAPFQIGVQDQLRNEGYAIITSSSAGEDAQESDALRSSIFTHHFLTALRGTADVNHDGQVTLGEAYAYAYEQALRTSMTTVVGSQHATFDYDLRGRADPVLADLRSARDQAQLVLPMAGEYLILSADGATTLMEANAKAPRTTLVLPPARYQVQLRTRTNVYRGDVALQAGQSTPLAERTLTPVPLAHVVRKGATEASLAQGPTVAALMHGPLGDQFSPMLGAQLGWAFELPHVTLLPRIGLSGGRSLDPGSDVAHHRLTETTAELSALYVFDWNRLSVAPLVSIGGAIIQQTIEKQPECTAVCRISARPLALLTSVGGWASYALGHRFTLDAGVEMTNFYLRHLQSATDAPATTTTPRFGVLTYRATVGLSYRY